MNLQKNLSQNLSQNLSHNLTQNLSQKNFKNHNKIRGDSPNLHYSTVTKKNLVNLKNDLQNFKNEMRRSLSANESGVRERLNSIGRSIKHLQKQPPKKQALNL